MSEMNRFLLQSNTTIAEDQPFSGSLVIGNNEPIDVGRRQFSPLLSRVVLRQCNSTHVLAKKHNLSQNFISYVLHGRKKSKRVEEIIEKEWGISVAEFQAVTRDWLERRSQGRGYSDKEIIDFADSVRARKSGKTLEEIQEMRNQILGGLV